MWFQGIKKKHEDKTEHRSEKEVIQTEYTKENMQVRENKLYQTF